MNIPTIYDYLPEHADFFTKSAAVGIREGAKKGDPEAVQKTLPWYTTGAGALLGGHAGAGGSGKMRLARTLGGAMLGTGVGLHGGEAIGKKIDRMRAKRKEKRGEIEKTSGYRALGALGGAAVGAVPLAIVGAVSGAAAGAAAEKRDERKPIGTLKGGLMGGLIGASLGGVGGATLGLGLGHQVAKASKTRLKLDSTWKAVQRARAAAQTKGARADEIAEALRGVGIKVASEKKKPESAGLRTLKLLAAGTGGMAAGTVAGYGLGRGVGAIAKAMKKPILPHQLHYPAMLGGAGLGTALAMWKAREAQEIRRAIQGS
jgi:hypothetical protein